jgi:hypothetical protein
MIKLNYLKLFGLLTLFAMNTSAHAVGSQRILENSELRLATVLVINHKLINDAFFAANLLGPIEISGGEEFQGGVPNYQVFGYRFDVCKRAEATASCEVVGNLEVVITTRNGASTTTATITKI